MKKDMEILEKYSLAEDFWLQKLETAAGAPIFSDKITPEHTTHAAKKIQNQLDLPPGGGTLYAAQTVCVDFHSSPGGGACASLPQNENSYITDLPFPPGLAGKIDDTTGGTPAKTFLIFLTALNILVYKYTSLRDILVTTTSFQPEEDEPGNSHDVLLFFRTELDSNSIPRDLLNAALQELNKADKHRQFQYESFLNRFLRQNPGPGNPLSELGFIHNGFNTNSRLIDGVHLVFRTRQQNRDFSLAVKYDTRYYQEEQVEQLGRHFFNTLGSMLEDLDKPVHAVDVFSQQDRQILLEHFSGEQVSYSSEEKTFIPCFEARVEKNPHSPAVKCHQQNLTYRQLNETANLLARWLKKETSIQPDDLVAIVMDRSEKMAQTIIATWKCGAAYVPVDPDFPGHRVKTIIEDSMVKLVIHEPGILHPQLIDQLKSITRVVSLEAIRENLKNRELTNTNLAVTVFPGNLAYVIYTSGSTGKPKGVMVEHPGMMNHLFAKVADIEITSASVIAQNASQCFDISVWQFFAALLKGGQTIVYTNQWVLNPEEFIGQIGSHGVTILEVVPSYLTMMLDIIEERKLDLLFPQLKYLLVTGETVRPTLVKRWFEKFPNIKMVNAYGPTEASDDITHYKMDRPPHPDTENIPIGRTVRNFHIYIVDSQMNLCPIGVKGEIVVFGIGIGRGYLNRPQLTTEKFCLRRPGGRRMAYGALRTAPISLFALRPALCALRTPPRKNFSLSIPHSPYSPHLPHSPIYKTGDLGRWLPDGNIQFFGRKDFQVKIRGYRIELEEIENKLAALPGIRDTVVIDKEDQEHNKHLYAYVTLQEGKEKKVEEIKRQLRGLLPEYMVPTNIVILETLPLTPNGKIDRKALPEPGAADISGLEYVPPGNDTEKKLAEIFQEILGIEKIGIHDSFFNLGGDSFKGIRIVNKIQEWLQEVVHVTILFLAPTIEELAKKLESYQVVKHDRVDTAKIEKMRRIIPPLPPLPHHRKSAVKNPPAIFILCPPRSGSTLLRVILTGHPQLFAPQEFELMTFNTLQERKKGLSGKFSFYLEGVIRAIMEIKGIDADQAKTIMEEFESKNLTCREFYRVLQEWLGEKILIEKTPAYTLDPEILKRIEEYFDSPLYLHLVRNPYAVIHSFENAKLDQIFKYEHDFPPRELAELVWLISHRNILEFLKNIPANRQWRINYEELVSEPEQVVSGICRFLGKEYLPELIQVYQDPRQRMTDGIYTESKMLGDVKFFSHTSINTGSVEKWKEKYKIQFLGDEAVRMARNFGYLLESGSLDYSGLEPAPEAELYALSPAQKRLWILSQFEDNLLAYNMPSAYLMQGNLDRESLENAFETVVRRHESLRTTFVNVNGEPRQKIHTFEESGFKPEYIDLRNRENREQEVKTIEIEEAKTPFDLEKGPLLRTRLIHLEENKYVFLLTTHHIIADGWSMRLLTNEILTLYDAYKNNKKNPLLPLPIQYKDYAEWHNKETNRQILKQQEEYWLKEFAGEIQLLNLPTDFERPELHQPEGSSLSFELDIHTTNQLKHIALQEGATLYMVLVALVNILLSKECDQEEIIIGTAIAGRRHAYLEPLIGFFVNMLAMRNFPFANKTFRQFLLEVKDRTMNAYENQDYQFEELVEKVLKTRTSGRNSLVDVGFAFQNFQLMTEDIPETIYTDLVLKPFGGDTMLSPFDINITSAENRGKLVFVFLYRIKLFKKETIQMMIQNFKEIVSAVIDNTDCLLKDIHISHDLVAVKPETLQEDEGDFEF